MNKIEAIVDAVGKLNGIHNPDSVAYLLRNPLLIKSFAKPGKHETTEEGIRRFTSLLSGYKAATYDLDLKLTGKSRAGLKAGDTLTNLLGVYGIKELLAVDNVVSFLRRALKDPIINRTTPLTYFVEGDK